MFTLVLILLVVWVVLALVLAAWTLFFQGYIYSEPIAAIHWRAPAAGAAVALAVVLWVAADYRAPGRYRTVLEFSPVEYHEPYEQMSVLLQGQRVPQTYKLVRTRHGGLEYRLDGRPTGRPLSGRPEKITVRDGGAEHVFEPERDAAGKIKVRTPGSWSLSREPEPVRYRDDRGLVMVEGQLGQLSTFHVGWLFVAALLHFLQLAAWFLALWLLLGFQWPHALGQAFVGCAVLVVFVLPPLLTRTEQVAEQRGFTTKTQRTQREYKEKKGADRTPRPVTGSSNACLSPPLFSFLCLLFVSFVPLW